jgi:hypothetical protein
MSTLQRTLATGKHACGTAPEERTDEYLDRLCGLRKWDPALGEDVWEEILKIIATPSIRERMDALEDLTILDVFRKAVKSRIDAEIKSGKYNA